MKEKVALSSLKGRLELEKNNNKSVREMARNVRVNNVEEFRKGSQPYLDNGELTTRPMRPFFRTSYKTDILESITRPMAEKSKRLEDRRTVSCT